MIALIILGAAGSSPQARGTPSLPPRTAPMNRFIPAGAGNAWPGSRERVPGAVHPRRRGERRPIPDGARAVGGSSPQARGTLGAGCRSVARSGFIPAGAGNARSAAVGVPKAAVHPRRRGERIGRRPCIVAQVGSSPQARGTHARFRRWTEIPRFIPAGAGNAMAEDGAGGRFPVHPRRRGEREYAPRLHPPRRKRRPAHRAGLFPETGSRRVP